MHTLYRVPGVIVTEANVDTMYPKRLTTGLKLADYGCALAHRRAWQRVVDGDNEWVVIIEDDAVGYACRAVAAHPMHPTHRLRVPGTM